MAENTWSLTYDDIVDGVKNYGRESLLSLGNGFLVGVGHLLQILMMMIFIPDYTQQVFLIKHQHRLPDAMSLMKI